MFENPGKARKFLTAVIGQRMGMENPMVEYMNTHVNGCNTSISPLANVYKLRTITVLLENSRYESEENSLFRLGHVQ